MKITYLGKDEKGLELVEKLNNTILRSRDVATSNSKENWITCKGCGEKVRYVFGDNGLCLQCDDNQ